MDIDDCLHFDVVDNFSLLGFALVLADVVARLLQKQYGGPNRAAVTPLLFMQTKTKPFFQAWEGL
jgi:hypothetical protein